MGKSKKEVSDAKPKTARSYRGTVVSDNAIISINIKWALQALALVAGLVYSYLQIENRIGELERRVELADTNIESIVLKMLDRWNKSDEISQRHREEMVRELNDLSDVMMEVKGSVSRINGKH